MMFQLTKYQSDVKCCVFAGVQPHRQARACSPPGLDREAWIQGQIDPSPHVPPPFFLTVSFSPSSVFVTSATSTTSSLNSYDLCLLFFIS